MLNCIGLFGTCGNSKWREPFMQTYKDLGIEFYNPQVENWDPSCAELETFHFRNDKIILFPVTSETYAFGSLAETGFSILSAIQNTMKNGEDQNIVLFIDPNLDDELKANSEAYKDSIRARKLVLSKLDSFRYSNVICVDSLRDMLSKSLLLFYEKEIQWNKKST